MGKIDISSTAVEKGIDLVKDFLERLVGSSIEEAGLLISDNIKLRRFKNQIKMLDKAQKIVAESNIGIKQISLKKIVPLLEYSSLEEEENLQDKWANLLVSFVNADQKYESTVFPYILSQLSSKEVIELDKLYETKINKPLIRTLSNIEISNLVRLGLIEIIDVNSKTNIRLFFELKVSYYDYLGSSHKLKTYIITDLGRKFVECCQPSLSKSDK